MNHVWLARSLSDDSPSQSIKHLNKALRLSKSSEETYREIIRLFSKDKKLTNLMNNYCMNYFNNFGGGAVDRIGAQDEQNFFIGNNSIFAISRVAGWAAHIIEEKFAEAAPKTALYRPKAVYVGKYCGPQGCEYKTLDLRK